MHEVSLKESWAAFCPKAKETTEAQNQLTELSCQPFAFDPAASSFSFAALCTHFVLNCKLFAISQFANC